MKDILGSLNRRTLLRAGAALGGGVIAGMPLSRAIWAAQGKVLKVRADGDVYTLDPGFYVGFGDIDVTNCIYSKLIKYKPGSEWGWELEAAEKIEQVDPTHIRFHLRKGITFTGGHGEMTARDVKFSFERVIKHNSPIKPDWGPLDHVDIEDDYTGVVVFKTPFVPVWNVALPFGVGHIVSEDAVMKATGNGSSFGLKPPAFSGPYVLAELKAKQYTVLTRNPEWSGPKPGFDEIRIIPINDDKTAERAYKAGDVDFTRISLDSFATVKSNPPAETEIEEHSSLRYYWIGMNIDHPKLKDINVRKAIQWAINVPQILDAAYAGQAEVATGTVPPSIVGHRESALIPPEGDLAKAKEFLDKAAVSDLNLTIDCLNESTYSTIAQTVQAQLSQIGITVEINVQDSGSFWTLGVESEGDRWKEMQLSVMYFNGLPDPHYATSWWVQDQVGVWNWERFRSDHFDELSAKGVTISDPGERAKVYHEMQDLMEESGAFRFLTYGGNPVMHRTTRMKAATLPDGRPLFLDFKPV
ncbi:Dipeptide ABC transporter, periplasmic dipeptide-binding protein [Mesorhizobium plurifarium]|uniref:Dipeptide ABC transporter, periplasmic dipeptide-binding protein n=1 Tax=Mesorhizobium plurifarium TaxID=69974 RepID=A0A090F950_MESPL|nr:Dipeptide ABC transporter, periplasmic dipeptide-binding protein [Mesorhizobium plurifarium]